MQWGRKGAGLESEPPRKAEVYRFHVATLILVPLIAIVLQAYVPLYFHSFSKLDLPLLVVIYFALARRSAAAGILGGALIGVAQDSLARDPIGLYAVSGTIVGFVAFLVSSRMEVESPGVRFLLVFVLYYLHFFSLYSLSIALLGESMEISVGTTVAPSLVNGVAGMLVFNVLDRFRTPA